MRKPKGITSRQMSKLHWSLRSKGTSYSKALKVTGAAKALSKRYGNSKMFPGKMRSYTDYDGDGKVNRYDCFPFDRRRQDDTRLTLKQRRMLERNPTMNTFSEKADTNEPLLKTYGEKSFLSNLNDRIFKKKEEGPTPFMIMKSKEERADKRNTMMQGLEGIAKREGRIKDEMFEKLDTLEQRGNKERDDSYRALMRKYIPPKDKIAPIKRYSYFETIGDVDNLKKEKRTREWKGLPRAMKPYTD